MNAKQITACLNFDNETLENAKRLLNSLLYDPSYKALPFYKERLNSAQRLVNDIQNSINKLQDELSARESKAKEPQTCHGFTKTGRRI